MITLTPLPQAALHDDVIFMIENIARYRTIKDPTNYKDTLIQLANNKALPCNTLEFKADDNNPAFIEVDIQKLSNLLGWLLLIADRDKINLMNSQASIK
ncbi:hypothetical protein ACPF04_09295 [Campylobacter sp. MOP51]|uniref:hypothetical protein n=1 Tax=Campylobacter canis TaxID=3378588 RepID=UPI003C68A6C8